MQERARLRLVRAWHTLLILQYMSTMETLTAEPIGTEKSKALARENDRQ